MNLEEFIKYIRKQGCRTRIYKNRHSVDGIAGYFNDTNGPIICVALGSFTEMEKLELLAHEFGHYLQYLDNKKNKVEELDSHLIHSKWIKGKIELNRKAWKAARNSMLEMEWDADLKAIKIAEDLNLTPWNTKNVLKWANAYNASMKWSWDTREEFNNSASRRYFPAKMLHDAEVVAPLSIKEFKKIDRLVRINNR